MNQFTLLEDKGYAKNLALKIVDLAWALTAIAYESGARREELVKIVREKVLVKIDEAPIRRDVVRCDKQSQREFSKRLAISCLAEVVTHSLSNSATED